jgi:hypothetical protein
LLIAATLHLISNRAMNSTGRDGLARRYTLAMWLRLERTMAVICQRDLVPNRLSWVSLPIIDTRRSGEKFGQKAFRSKSGIASPETDNAVDHVGVFH